MFITSPLGPGTTPLTLLEAQAEISGTPQTKLEAYTSFTPQLGVDLLAKVVEFLELETEFLEPGVNNMIAKTEKEETYFLASDELAKIIFKYFDKDGPAFACLNLHMEAYKAAFEYIVADLLASRKDRSVKYHKEQLEKLTAELETQEMLFLDLKDHSRMINIFTKPSYCTLKFLKRFAENFGKFSWIVKDRVFYNIEIEATSILRLVKEMEPEVLEKLQTRSQAIIEKLKLVLPQDKILSERLKSCRTDLQVENLRFENNCVSRLLAFLINGMAEDPISILRDYIKLRQNESDAELKNIIQVGLCWSEIVDDKTLVRHFTSPD